MTDWLPTAGFPLAGSLSGDFRLTGLGERQQARAEVRFQGPQLAAAGITVRALVGRAAYRRGEIELEATGTTVDGDLSVRGRARPGTADSHFDGQLRLVGGQLGAVRKTLGGGPTLGPLTGAVDLELDLRIPAPSAARIEATGRASLRDVRWGRFPLVPSATGAITLTQGELRVEDIKARVAGGRGSGTLRLGLRDLDGDFELLLERLRWRQAMAPWPQLGRYIDGSCEVRLAGHLGRQWSGAGRIRWAHGHIAGVPIQEAQAPFRYRVTPARGTGQLVVRDVVLRPPRGRVTGAVDLRWRPSLQIRGAARLVGIDIHPLARAAASIDDTVRGQLNGQVTVEGRRVQSLDDLAGTFKASLRQSRLLRLPVFDQVVDALVVGQLVSPGAETSTVTGRLRGRTIFIDEATLVGTAIRLLIDGTMTTRGRLDLNVTGDTGQMLTHLAALRAVINPLTLLRRRLVFLHVGGTLRRPTVEIRPLEQLSQEVAIFFLR
jgi:hypothetical protein